MRENGFSLVELLAVLVLLSVIILVAFPSILGAIKKSDSEITEATKELLIANAKTYVNDTQPSGATGCVLVRTLIDNNYTEAPIPNASEETSKNIEDHWGIRYEFNASTGKYTNFSVSETGC